MNICERIVTSRPKGKVTCHQYRGADVISRKDRLKRLGFYVLPDHLWNKIDSKTANRLIVESLCTDLIDDEKIIEEEKVVPLVNGFISAMPDNAEYFSNCNGGFEPISNSFLDVAIIVELRGMVGFVCVEEFQP